MSDNLSQWISSEVQKRGWTLRYAAKRARISHATMARIANGEVPKPSPRVCSAVAGAFGVSVEKIYRMAGMLPESVPVVRERRMRYQVGDVTMTDRMVELFEQLSAEDQELIVLLLEKWSGRGLEPRIIGDTTDE